MHQEVEGNLHIEIDNFIKKSNCNIYESPFDVRLIKNIKQKDQEITTVVQPDICVVCDLEKLDEKGCVGAPDLIIEVVSTSTTKKDYNKKFNLYQENGVKEYGLVNPDAKSLQVFCLENELYQEFKTLEEKKKLLSQRFSHT